MAKKMIEDNFEKILVFLFIFWLVAKIFIRFEPLDYFPNSDSAVFLYIGRSILHGHIPYLDTWDHKGPLLYYINAFGLWIFGLWGVWIFEFILTFGGLYTAYLSGRKLLGFIPSFVGIITGCYLLDLSMAGNITEEYTSSLALLTFGIYVLYSQSTAQKLFLLGIGFLFMCSLLVRPNNIGFQFAIILSIGIVDIIEKDLRNLWDKISWIGLGMSVILVPFLIYFNSKHALGDLYDQAFRYNLIYIKTSNSDISAEEFLSPAFKSLVYITVASYFIVLFYTRKIMTAPQLLENRLTLALSLAFPLEYFLSGVSGRGYIHYYLTWLPYIIFACGFSINRIFRTDLFSEKTNRTLLLLISLAYFLIWSPLTTLRRYIDIGKYFIYHRANGIEKNNPLADYINDNTNSEDTVLRWGFGGWLNYSIDRDSPDRYLYQFALITPGYTTDKIVDDFGRDLEYKKPKFIIESFKYFIPISSKKLALYDGYVHPKYANIIRFIEENYHIMKGKFELDGQTKEDTSIKIWMLNTAVEHSP